MPLDTYIERGTEKLKEKDKGWNYFVDVDYIL